MINRDPIPVKKFCLWFLVVIVGMAIAFVIFISVISVIIGIRHFNQDGFIIPILAGIFSTGFCLFIFIGFLKFIINVTKEKDIIRTSG